MRVVIVDDERAARRRLSRLLAEAPDVELAGEAADGAEAAEVVRATRPDVLFLDVEMPEADGFEALRLMGADRPPTVVFVTAFDQYAVRAFEACALDYLLKPVERERLAATLERVRSRAGVDDIGERLSRLERTLAASSAPPRRVLARKRERLVPLDPATVVAFVAENRLVFALTLDDRLLVDATLTELEERLSSDRFARAHRGALVNLDRVEAVEPAEWGGLVLHLDGGHRIEVSRRLAPSIRSRLGGDSQG